MDKFEIMDKNDLKWILNGLNGNHTLENGGNVNKI